MTPLLVAPACVIAALLVLGAALVAGLGAMRTPTAKSAEAPADAFSAERAWPLLERLVGDGTPHPVGTPANARVRARVAAELTALGYQVEEQAAFACRAQWFTCAHVVNVMTRLPGSAEGPAVLLTAHYDSVGAGPGAADDMAGVAVVLEVARLLRDAAPLRNPVIFLLTDGEEAGLLGAEGFATHPWLQDVGVVVNLEARGSRGQSLLFETSADNAWLIAAFAAAAPRPVTNSLLYELYRLLPNDTDLTVYRQADLAGVNFGFVEEIAHYHTPLDDLVHLDRGSLQHHGDNALAAARAFGRLDLTDPPAGNSLYLDLLPGRVLQVPEASGPWVALACLVVWLGLIAASLRRRSLSWAALLSGLLATLLGLALATGSGFAVTAAVRALSGLPAPWYAQPLPTRIALWAAAGLAAALCATSVARRSGFWGLAAATWLWWAILGLATVVALPGASVVLLVPTVVATVLFGLVGFTPLRTRAWAPPAAALVAGFVAAYLWLPFALSIESGIGMDLSPAIAFCVALAVATLTPLLALPRHRVGVRTAALLGTLAVSVAATVWAASVPAFTVDRPQRMNLVHLATALDGEVTSANWILDRWPPAPLPADLARVGDFASTPAAALPWTTNAFLAAPAPVAAVPPPTLEVLREVPEDGGQVVTARLRSPRGGERLLLLVPREAGLRRIVLPGTPYVLTPAPSGGALAYHVFACHGVACDGTELELHLASANAVAMLVADQTAGLPDGGAALQAARPATAVPSQDGDVSIVLNRVSVAGP